MIDILRNSVMITGFVFVMMLVIEYINVITSGRLGRRLARSSFGQYILAALLGALPGCLGAFAVVAMFSHRIVGLGALITAMIATSGDETFVMIALIPRSLLILVPALMVAGIVAGMLTDSLSSRVKFLERIHCDGLKVHTGHEGNYFPRGRILDQWRGCSPARGILAVVLLLLILAVSTGQFSHHMHELKTGFFSAPGEVIPPEAGGHADADEGHSGIEHGHGDTGDGHGGWGWIRITLLVTSLLALFIVVTVPDHFLDEHLWRHIAVRHVPSIFLWIFGALVAMHLITSNLEIDLAGLVSRGQWFVLLAACLLGLIPQSGPHLIFITLFAGGYVPFSVLLANSMVQDGHGMLPLLAHSRRVFILIKLVNLAFGLAVGAAAMAAGI
jgi:hypothetical protein